MGLWQKLFGWLNPSVPTAAQVDDTASAGPAAPAEPGFAAAQEPVFDPRSTLNAAAPAVPGAPTAPDLATVSEGSENLQPDLFEAAAQAEAARLAALPAVINDPVLRDALSVYAGMAWERQIDFAERVGERPWSADASQGLIQFGDDLRFRMQVLGSYSLASGTWQWIWANTQAEVPAGFTEVARQLLGFGNAQQLALFTQPRSELRVQDLHTIGLIAAGADESAGYYLGNYGEGIMLVLIDPVQGLPLPAHIRPERVLSVVPQLMGEFELNHRLLLQHYLPAKGFVLEESAGQIVGRLGKHTLTASFDDAGRLHELTGDLQAG